MIECSYSTLDDKRGFQNKFFYLSIFVFISIYPPFMIKIIFWMLLFILGSSFANASCDPLGSTYSEYLACKTRISAIFDKWYDAFSIGRYSESISYFENYIYEVNDSGDTNYAIAKKNLSISYKKYADSFFMKGNYNEAINYYSKAISIDWKLQSANYLLSESYFAINELNNSQMYAQIAHNNATSASDIDDAKKILQKISDKIKLETDKLNSPSNDPLSFLQYYIKDLNINTAWSQITNPKQIIVAIIDDGININHPDLTNNIWISQNSSYGSSKIISFQNDWLPDNATAWEHWTMVAGIIGSTTNNNEGISGIAENIKLMPIRIFDTDGNTREEYIIKAINYAVDNGANIINMSLWWSQFKYSKWMDDVIKKAYDRWVFVVIAWGNGDVLANRQNWVNLDINPISPVCNNKGNNYSFGVYATNRVGIRSIWTNYGKCTPFYAPWEEIVSTSVAWYNKELWINYNQLDGTSFSAPIVSGILALGYNKYGRIPYSVAYDSLSRATVINSKWNPILDANKYLNNIQSYFDKQNASKTDGLKRRAQIQFDLYKKQYTRFPRATQKLKYQSLLVWFQKKSKTLKGDIAIINNSIIELLTVEIAKT